MFSHLTAEKPVEERRGAQEFTCCVKNKYEEEEEAAGQKKWGIKGGIEKPHAHRRTARRVAFEPWCVHKIMRRTRARREREKNEPRDTLTWPKSDLFIFLSYL